MPDGSSLPTPHVPFAHQSDYLREHGDAAAWGLFWEQGTGKSKALIDGAANLFRQRKAQSALVLAPNGVHHNWVVDQLPEHWPRDLSRGTFEWSTARASGTQYKKSFDTFLSHTARGENFGWLCMSYDGIMTEAGKQATWDFMRSRPTLYILDESQRAKTPNAARTKRIIKSSVYAPYRRVASGTPADSPFDIYSQIRFLDADFWARELGIGSFTAFKQWFGVWQQRMLSGGRSFPDLVAYRDLPTLEKVLRRISNRVLKEDAMDLPPKLYRRAYHALAPAQRDAYASLKEEARALLESGELVTAANALALQVRLSQVTSGFTKTTDGTEVALAAENPRTRLLREMLEDLEGAPAIVWVLFTRDAEQAAVASRLAGREPVIYDGDDVAGTLDAWKAGKGHDLIGNLHSTMAEGYTLVRASHMFYYSRSERLIARLQSEDRAHRPGMRDALTITDLLAEGTADVANLGRLQKKRGLVGSVFGDRPETISDWLREVAA